MTTEQEIAEQGAHLAEIHQVLCASALCILGMAPEVAKHVSQEQAEAFAAFTRDVLKPVVENIDGQLDALREQYLAAHGEVADLEAALQLPEVDPQNRPGAGGYL